MKKLIGLLLILSLLLSVATLVSCGGDGETEGTLPPATETPTETEEQPEATETPTEAPAADVNCDLTITDQDGTPLAGLDFNLTPQNDSLSAIKLETNDEGKCEGVILKEGKYAVSYQELPEGHLANDTELTVSADQTDYTLTVINNIPNGTMSRPYIISEETTTVTIPAGTSPVYMTYGAKDCEFTMQNATLTVSYKDADYAPDAEGVVKFPFISEGPRDPAYITFKNTTDADVEITFDIKPALGSYNNPILVEQTGEIITAMIPKDQTVYYKWVATKNGVAAVTSDTDKNQIAMTNLNTSANSYYTNGSGCEYLVVSEGDEVMIAVAATGSAEIAEIPFAMAVYAGTAEEPMPVLKDESLFVHAAGESRVYSYSGNASLLRVEGKGVKLVVGDKTYEAGDDGKLELALTPGETVTFVLENTADTRLEIAVYAI